LRSVDERHGPHISGNTDAQQRVPADGLRPPLNPGLLLSGCAPGVALTRVAGFRVTSLTHVAAGEIMPAAETQGRYTAPNAVVISRCELHEILAT